MQVLIAVFGLIALVCGRKLFWIFIGIAGFFAGLEFAGTSLSFSTRWAALAFGVGAGLVGAVLAVLVQRAAFALAGFYAGAYLALVAVHFFDVPEAAVFGVPAGAVCGAVAAFVLMDWAIIVLSALVGAAAVVGVAPLSPGASAAACAVLLGIGIWAQSWGMRPRVRKSPKG